MDHNATITQERKRVRRKAINKQIKRERKCVRERGGERGRKKTEKVEYSNCLGATLRFQSHTQLPD